MLYFTSLPPTQCNKTSNFGTWINKGSIPSSYGTLDSSKPNWKLLGRSRSLETRFVEDEKMVQLSPTVWGALVPFVTFFRGAAEVLKTKLQVLGVFLLIILIVLMDYLDYPTGFWLFWLFWWWYWLFWLYWLYTDGMKVDVSNLPISLKRIASPWR